ncbi:MAG TPA: YciI family protein, partial [Syntrophales bacterium]|nr:YciI family protein [Syntrophales bacterium]
RRMAKREAHLAGVAKMKAEGKALYGIAMLDDEENMVGSVMVMDFPSRAELDGWLKVEPYVVGKVWKRVEVFKAKVPPIFLP